MIATTHRTLLSRRLAGALHITPARTDAHPLPVNANGAMR